MQKSYYISVTQLAVDSLYSAFPIQGSFMRRSTSSAVVSSMQCRAKCIQTQTRTPATWHNFARNCFRYWRMAFSFGGSLKYAKRRSQSLLAGRNQAPIFAPTGATSWRRIFPCLGMGLFLVLQSHNVDQFRSRQGRALRRPFSVVHSL